MASEVKSTRTSTIIILAIALALRLFVLRTMLLNYPRGWLFTRGMEMDLLAKSILAGNGLSSPFGPPTGPTAFIAPGYPLLIAAIFKLFGIDTLASAVVVFLLQTALNLLTIWLMLRIARRLFSRGTATIAGLVWACSLPLIWLPTIFWDTSLAICLLTGLVAMVLRFGAQMRPARWFLIGAYCGFTALINPAMLPILIVIAGWLLLQQSANRLGGAFIATLTFILVFSPWPIRNAKVFDAFIPLRTTVGFELWMGNRPGADGFLDESLFPSFNPQELSDYKARGELGYTAHKSELARRFIISHPTTFVRLTALRFIRYWIGTGSRNGSPIFALHAVLTSFFGLLGLWFLVRAKRYSVALLFGLPLLLFPFPYYITHAEFRYRLALDTLLSILAAHAVVTVYSYLDRRSTSVEITPLAEVHG